jgi:hypothetical protein
MNDDEAISQIIEANKDKYLQTRPLCEADIPIKWDKKQGAYDWREWSNWISTGQQLKRKASYSQDFALIEFDTDQPLTVIFISDTHWGSWATDYERLRIITDEILGTPNLYVGLIGDLEQMAIKLRNVLEVSDNVLPPELQHRFTESWLAEIQHRVLFSTWDNHAVMREEAGAGYSRFADLMKRQVIYHNGIGHPDIKVGGETYRLAVSHRFRGNSYLNPVHAQGRYKREEGQDRELIVQGDTHKPGLFKGHHGRHEAVYVNCGALQVDSGYAKRHFSLFTHAVYPCVTFYPDEHIITPWYTLREWKRATEK